MCIVREREGLVCSIGRRRKDVNLAMAGNILDWGSPGVSRAVVFVPGAPPPLLLSRFKSIRVKKRHVPLCITAVSLALLRLNIPLVINKIKLFGWFISISKTKINQIKSIFFFSNHY